MSNEKVVIVEQDQTLPTGSAISSDIVYIPGFASKTKQEYIKNPTLFTSVSDFESAFGKTPYKFTSTDIGTAYKLDIKEGDSDKSYIMAKALLNAGLPVLYECFAANSIATESTSNSSSTQTDSETKETISGTSTNAIKELYDGVLDSFTCLQALGEFNVKYITSGAYPMFFEGATEGATEGAKGTKNAKDPDPYPYADAQLKAAATRGDAVAIIDYAKGMDDKLSIADKDSIYRKANEHFKKDDNSVFGAMFAPYATYNLPDGEVILPASFAYLISLATAIKTSPNWLAIAGVTRGAVPYIKKLECKPVLTNVIAENYQPKKGTSDNEISINAITNINPYGLCIWGNRTLGAVDAKGTRATNFLNIRNMISDIKKLAYTTAHKLMFEQSSDILWNKFKYGLSPLLKQLVSGNAISDYKIIKGTVNHNGEPLARGELAAVIKIYPMYAIEYFDITVVISDNDVTVE